MGKGNFPVWCHILGALLPDPGPPSSSGSCQEGHQQGFPYTSACCAFPWGFPEKWGMTVPAMTYLHHMLPWCFCHTCLLLCNIPEMYWQYAWSRFTSSNPKGAQFVEWTAACPGVLLIDQSLLNFSFEFWNRKLNGCKNVISGDYSLVQAQGLANLS